MAVRRLPGRPLVDGVAQGPALVTDTPLSFWGGIDPERGTVIDKRHPLAGAQITGSILVLPSGRGSCSASGVFLESIANQTAPAGIIVSETDPVLGLGAVLGEELLGRTVPVVLLGEEDRRSIGEGERVTILAGGMVEVSPAD